MLTNPDEFWENLRVATREIIREEIKEIQKNNQPEDLILMEEACKILHKSKSMIYQWVYTGRLIGYTFEGAKINNTENLKDVKNLYFLKSDLYAGLKEIKK